MRGSIGVVVEGREESLNISLYYFLLNHIVLDYVEDEVSQLINRHISISISFHFFLNLVLKLILAAEHLLESSVDPDHLPLDLLDCVLWYLGVIKHDIVIIKDGLWLGVCNSIR